MTCWYELEPAVLSLSLSLFVSGDGLRPIYLPAGVQVFGSDPTLTPGREDVLMILWLAANYWEWGRVGVLNIWVGLFRAAQACFWD